MNISKHEAKEALEAVQLVSNQMRQSLATGSTPYYMILWGAIWFLGYIGSHFTQDFFTGWIWLGLVGTGMVVSFILGMYFRTKMRFGSYGRVMFLWISLMIYAALVWWIAAPSSGEQASMLIVIFCMFGYVITGIWMEPTAAWVGGITTALAMIGYAFFLPYFYLWMALLGGGTLILSGIYILRRWK
jgi:hypothetical protein